MSHPELDKLPAKDLEHVTGMLKGLISSLKARMGITGHGTHLLKDEEIIIQSLLHPERGDVMITMVKDRNEMHIFVSNRRDPSSPFVLMDFQTLRKYPGRRPVDNMHNLKEGEHGIFLSTQQDRDIIKSNAATNVEVYSTHFGVQESPIEHASEVVEVQSPVKNHWEQLRNSASGDPSIQSILKEMCGFTITFARHGMPEKMETVVLPPEKEKSFLGQLVRDMYPYGVRVLLRRENQQEHSAKLSNVHSALKKIKEAALDRVVPENPEGYNKYLQGLVELVSHVLEKDPELSGFV